jgi:hypothetical protein
LLAYSQILKPYQVSTELCTQVVYLFFFTISI